MAEMGWGLKNPITGRKGTTTGDEVCHLTKVFIA